MWEYMIHQSPAQLLLIHQLYQWNCHSPHSYTWTGLESENYLSFDWSRKCVAFFIKWLLICPVLSCCYNFNSNKNCPSPGLLETDRRKPGEKIKMFAIVSVENNFDQVKCVVGLWKVLVKVSHSFEPFSHEKQDSALVSQLLICIGFCFLLSSTQMDCI